MRFVLRFGRKERPNGEKARNQMSKTDEWLLHLPREGDMVMIASLYISKIKLFASLISLWTMTSGKR